MGVWAWFNAAGAIIPKLWHRYGTVPAGKKPPFTPLLSNKTFRASVGPIFRAQAHFPNTETGVKLGDEQFAREIGRAHV